MTNDPKPCGLGLIKSLSFLLLLVYGFIELLAFGLSGLRMPSGFENTANAQMAFSLVISLFYLLAYVALRAEPSKKIWLCLNGFWLLLLLLTIGQYLPHYFWLASASHDANNYTPGYILVNGFPFLFISASLIYFQTARVKEYFGFKRKPSASIEGEI
jgi:hypothetical protein